MQPMQKTIFCANTIESPYGNKRFVSFYGD